MLRTYRRRERRERSTRCIAFKERGGSNRQTAAVKRATPGSSNHPLIGPGASGNARRRKPRARDASAGWGFWIGTQAGFAAVPGAGFSGQKTTFGKTKGQQRYRLRGFSPCGSLESSGPIQNPFYAAASADSAPIANAVRRQVVRAPDAPGRPGKKRDQEAG